MARRSAAAKTIPNIVQSEPPSPGIYCQLKIEECQSQIIFNIISLQLSSPNTTYLLTKGIYRWQEDYVLCFQFQHKSNYRKTTIYKKIKWLSYSKQILIPFFQKIISLQRKILISQWALSRSFISCKRITKQSILLWKTEMKQFDGYSNLSPFSSIKYPILKLVTYCSSLKGTIIFTMLPWSLRSRSYKSSNFVRLPTL